MIHKSEQLRRPVGGFPLGAEQPAMIEAFMRNRGWLAAGERVKSCGPAGNGNMNVTLRVGTTSRSLIVKHAPPFVARYPWIAAPAERIVSERRFYERVAEEPVLAEQTPRLLSACDAEGVLLFEDVVGAVDTSSMYSTGLKTSERHIEAIAGYAATLHVVTRHDDGSRFENHQMRALNHAYCFVHPFDDRDSARLEAIEPGLAAEAARLVDNEKFRSRVNELGSLYLGPGSCLVHGDYFPGSWLYRKDRVWVIDPEFSFFGLAEIDIGCAVAHFAIARLPLDTARRFITAYERARSDTALDYLRVAGFAGIEVTRRLIGTAQLPLPSSISWRRELLARSVHTVNNGKWELLWR